MKMIAIAIVAAFAVPAAAAEPKFDAEATAKKLAPFIDQYTFLVGRMDVREFDTASVLALVERIFQGDPEEKATLRTTSKAWQTEFAKKGGREIYVVYGPGDFPHLPCLLTPIGESPAERKDLFEFLRLPFDGNPEQSNEPSWANINGFLCVGTKAGIERLKRKKPCHRADIVEALASAGDAPFRIVFAPSADTRKVFEEVSPTLPAEVGGGSIQTFTRGMKWMSLSAGPAPKVETRIVIQAADAETAKNLQGFVVKGLDSAKSLFQASDSKEREMYLKFYRRVVQLLTPKVEKDHLVISHELGTVLPELAKLLKEVQPAARGISANNLKQLGLACHNFAATYPGDRFPTNITDKNGKPLLSWRVAILPYIEHSELYKEFKLDEPWDSEHNKKLIAMMPKIYRSPKQSSEMKDRTTYLAPLGKGLMWDDPKGVRFQDITDGTSNTILLVESNDENAVIWTKPDDIAIDMKNPAKGLLGHWDDGFLALIADSSVRFVRKDYSAIWAMFTKAGGEVLSEK